MKFSWRGSAPPDPPSIFSPSAIQRSAWTREKKAMARVFHAPKPNRETLYRESETSSVAASRTKPRPSATVKHDLKKRQTKLENWNNNFCWKKLDGPKLDGPGTFCKKFQKVPIKFGLFSDSPTNYPKITTPIPDAPRSGAISILVVRLQLVLLL